MARASLAVIAAASLALLGSARAAHAQACCAGSTAVTPGRLALHEDALVGISVRATDGYGSFDPAGTFAAMPAGTGEVDLEQDLFAALRFARRAQAALLVPLVETRRDVPGETDFGGGVGDLNASARYDFLYASEARYVPGIAALVGVTVPTGRPPEAATDPLAADATGVGAYQLALGLALEKTFGPWLVGATGTFAKRATRTANGVSESLAAQWTGLALAAYTLRNGAAFALSSSLTTEGDAQLAGELAPGSHRRLVAVSLSGVYPATDELRIQAALTFDPPVSAFGENQPVAGVGATATLIYAWL